MPVSGHPTPSLVSTIWFGMRCAFTQAALAGALDIGGVIPVAIVLPRGPTPSTAGWPEPPFDRWLRERDITIIETDRLTGPTFDTVLETIRTRGIALGVGACFPWKVPASLRASLSGGVFNIHPSLLPALRGPEPVFHAYRLGLAESGVTIHLMDDGWDTGPVLGQERVPIPDTGRAEAFEAVLAERGGRLLGQLAPTWIAGTAAIPQDDTDATWAPLPSDSDRMLPAGLTIAQATRFLRACGPLLARDTSGALVAVRDAVEASGPDEFRRRADRGAVVAPCVDGVLWVW